MLLVHSKARYVFELLCIGSLPRSNQQHAYVPVVVYRKSSSPMSGNTVFCLAMMTCNALFYMFNENYILWKRSILGTSQFVRVSRSEDKFWRNNLFNLITRGMLPCVDWDVDDEKNTMGSWRCVLFVSTGSKMLLVVSCILCESMWFA